MRITIYIIILVSIIFGCKDNSQAKKRRKSPNDIPQIYYSVINEFPHSTKSFTEGLLFHNGDLFESTGSPGNLHETKSVIGILNLETGEIDVKRELNRNIYFGEGIAILNNKVYHLTYKRQTCFVYDLKTFDSVTNFMYSNKEGWGLTTDGKNLIMSDGTDKLSYINPENFEKIKTLKVTANSYAIDYLNELEYIKGYLYANVWPTNNIVRIDPKNGHVIGVMDLTLLQTIAINDNPEIDVANGIAYDSITGNIFVTGKMWPKIYELEILN